MKRFAAYAVLVLFVAVPRMFAQEFTADQILAKLDEKAKVFTSLQASVKKQKSSLGKLTAVESGTLTMAPSKDTLRVLMEISEPRHTKYLLDNGKATMYDVKDNTYNEARYDPKSEQLSYLMLGFGTPAATIRKGYKAEVKAREMVNGVNAYVLELTSTSKLTDARPLITLWLDPKEWTPVQIRLAETPKKWDEFRYSKVQLNRTLSGSAFDPKMKSGAKKN